MGKIIAFILILVVWGILWAFPLWAVVNFVCWAFHLSFHLSYLQAFASCLLASMVRNLLFEREDK